MVPGGITHHAANVGAVTIVRRDGTKELRNHRRFRAGGGRRTALNKASTRHRDCRHHRAGARSVARLWPFLDTGKTARYAGRAEALALMRMIGQKIYGTGRMAQHRVHAPGGFGELIAAVGQPDRKDSLRQIVRLIAELLDVVRADVDHSVVPILACHRHACPVTHQAHARNIVAHTGTDG